MDYKFSIIIPVYNAEPYIRLTIDSVINQTYDNWELILIDDGSTDNSPDICQVYHDRRIRYYRFDNQGQMFARINGVNKATGDYSIIVDADDSLTENCLEAINQVLLQNPYDMVFFSFNLCDKNLNVESTMHFKSESQLMEQMEAISYIVDNWNHQLWNKAVATTLLQNGAKEAITKKVKINGDYALVIPVMCYVKTVCLLDEPLYNYRVLESSLSHNYSLQHIMDTDYVGCSVLETLKKHDLCTDYIKKSVQIANLKMIIMIVKGVVEQKGLSPDDLEMVNRMTLYSESREYEKRRILGRADYITAKIIRSKRISLLKWVVFIHKIENAKVSVMSLLSNIIK